MSETFKVKVNNTYEIDITSKELSQLDSVYTSTSKLHVLHKNVSYKAEVTEANFNQKAYKVIVNNNTYNINIYNALDGLIKSLGFEVGATKKINDIKAPMPGLILDITINVGQEVKENDTLLILEAMKMENVLTSPRDGVIKSISVKKGEAVDKNQLLIVFE